MKLLPIALLTITSLLPLAAQTTTGTVTGFVTDSGGALIAEAAVKLTNTGTGLVQSTVSNETGSYVFPLVQPGSYQITVEKSGFQTFARTFQIAVTQQARIDAQLTVGQVSDFDGGACAAEVRSREGDPDGKQAHDYGKGTYWESNGQITRLLMIS